MNRRDAYWTSTRRLRSSMYLPSLYFWDWSYALSYILCENHEWGKLKGAFTYFQPRVVPHLQQYISRTVCLPVVIGRSSGSPSTTFTLVEMPVICKLNDRTLRQWMTVGWLTRHRKDMHDHVGRWKPVHDKVRYNKDGREDERDLTRDIIEWMVARCVLHVEHPYIRSPER